MSASVFQVLCVRVCAGLQRGTQYLVEALKTPGSPTLDTRSDFISPALGHRSLMNSLNEKLHKYIFLCFFFYYLLHLLIISPCDEWVFVS